MATAKKVPAKRKARSVAPVAPKKVAPARKQAKKPVAAQKTGRTGARTPAKVEPGAPVAGLSVLEARFVQEFIVDLNGTQAYLRSKPGAKETTARTEASKWLAKPNIAAAVRAAIEERAKRTDITADRVIREAWAIMTADPRELMEYRVGCCRYCHGVDHLYQRTSMEFDRDEATLARMNEDAIAAGKPVKAFDPLGGVGYDKRLPPDPDCPECFGEGEGREVFHDTRTVSKAAASLFAGVEVTRHGRKVLTHSKDAAMDKMFRHLGLYNDKIQLTMPMAVIKDMTGRKPE